MTDTKIDFQKFRLHNSLIKKNSRTEYEIQHNEKNYAYGFVFNDNEIVEEWVYESGTKTEIKIFERNIANKQAFDVEYLLI